MGFLRSYAFAQRLCPPLRKERRTFFVPQRASRNATARAASCGSASAVQCAAARFAKYRGSCRVVRHPLLPCAALQPFVATRLCLRFRLHLPASNPAAPSRPRPAAPSRAAFRLFFARTALYRAFLPGIWKKVRFRAILFSGAIGFMRKRKRFPS